jgi:hypothetical protein
MLIRPLLKLFTAFNLYNDVIAGFPSGKPMLYHASKPTNLSNCFIVIVVAPTGVVTNKAMIILATPLDFG